MARYVHLSEMESDFSIVSNDILNPFIITEMTYTFRRKGQSHVWGHSLVISASEGGGGRTRSPRPDSNSEFNPHGLQKTISQKFK